LSEDFSQIILDLIIKAAIFMGLFILAISIIQLIVKGISRSKGHE
jgi:hypothetical protein